MAYTEKELRENLAKNLEMIEPGLKLVEQERKVKWENSESKIFHAYIDILARDVNDNYVIIELKKSKQASRSALHEIYKYVDGLVAEFSLRYDEIRVMVISTDWNELQFAFSLAQKQNNINLEGYYLQVSEENNLSIKSVERVQLRALNEEREMAKHGIIYCYDKYHPLKEDIILRYKNRCEEAGLENYIMLIFENVDDPYSSYTHVLYCNNPYQNLSLYKYIIKKYNKEITADRLKSILESDSEDINDSAIAALFFDIDLETSGSQLGDIRNLRYYLLNFHWKLMNYITGSKMPKNHTFLTRILSEVGGTMFDISEEGIFKYPNKASLHNAIQEIRKKLAPVAIWRDAFVNELLDLQDRQEEENYSGTYVYRMKDSLTKCFSIYSNQKILTNMLMPHALLEISFDDRYVTLFGGIWQEKEFHSQFLDIFEKYYPSSDIYSFLNWFCSGFSYTDSMLARDIGCSFFVVKAINYKDIGKQDEYYIYTEIGYEKIPKKVYDYAVQSILISSKLLEQVREVYASALQDVLENNIWLKDKNVFWANFDTDESALD